MDLTSKVMQKQNDQNVRIVDALTIKRMNAGKKLRLRNNELLFLASIARNKAIEWQIAQRRRSSVVNVNYMAIQPMNAERRARRLYKRRIQLTFSKRAILNAKLMAF